MLSFLVSSKGRRRLLMLLWDEHASGTATQLSKRARVSFATAYRELQNMKRWELVRTSPSDDGEVFAATSSSRTSKPFALARAWGLRMRADAEWFESLFRKFATVPVGA